MPTGTTESWYCEHIVDGPWPFVLLALPLLGAYFYGQKKRKRGLILIGVWVPLQLAFAYVNNMVVDCSFEEQPIGGATSPEQPPPQQQ